MNIRKIFGEQSFRERVERCTKSGWIRMGIWCTLYVLFVLWVSVGHWVSLFWLLLLPLIADVFVTKYIHWSWWKALKEKQGAGYQALYTVCSWVDAILFALVAVYFINLYFFQNYQIPSSSLEKSLRVGDFLYVSKAEYGARVPQTPLSFPLVQHTFPAWLGGGKSYIEHPQWEYRRLPGFTSPKKGDIVVFNFPAGDTVCSLAQNPDFYTLRWQYGEDVLRSREDIFGEILTRPVDRRENYVKRCVATPGDTLLIVSNQVYINGAMLADHEGVQYNYYVQTNGGTLSAAYLDKLGVSKDDRKRLNANLQSVSPECEQIAEILGLDAQKPIYYFPLTREMKASLEENEVVDTMVIEPANFGGDVYPLGAETRYPERGWATQRGWNRDNYGPIYMPKKGDQILLTEDNYEIYIRPIRAYEHSNAKIGDRYTFQMDYYWMMGDNRHNSADSRYWGFVPEDHIVGKPRFVWLSIEKDKGWFDGHIRWERIGRNANK